jgi:hypothetical protein
VLLFHRQFYGLLWFWAVVFNAVFAKAFQSLTCESVRSVLGNVEGCGIQHLFFCLLTTGWKYDLCRYQFVVNTFFISFTSILYLFLLYLRFTHIQYVLFQTYRIQILYIRTYKPLHMLNIKKHIQYTHTSKNVTHHNLHKTENGTAHKTNS